MAAKSVPIPPATSQIVPFAGPGIAAHETTQVDRGQLAHRSRKAGHLLGVLAEVLPNRVAKRAPVPGGLGAIAQLPLELCMGGRVGGSRLIGDPSCERVRVILAQGPTQARQARPAAAVEANQARGRGGAQDAQRHIL